MRAKDLLFEFLETVFFIACVLFFFFYLFLGGYFAIAQKIVVTACVLSIIALIFVIKFKVTRQQLLKIEKESFGDEILAQLDGKDIFWDRVVTLMISLLLFLPPFINGTFNGVDVFQSVTFFIYMFSWRFFLFLDKDSVAKVLNLLRKDEIKDSAAIFFLPVILLMVTLLNGGADLIDFIQIAIAFTASYCWHKRLFK
jgi:hypothetical protein